MQLCFQNVSHVVQWQYRIIGAFYLTQIISLCIAQKRKDFWMMLLHHLMTLIFTHFSWLVNGHSLGSIFLLFHDASDIFVEGGKCFNYAKQGKAALIVLVLFCIVWIFTRLIVIPRIMYTFVFKPRFSLFPAYMLGIVGALIDLIMQIVWTRQIIDFTVKSFEFGGLQEDVRSDSSTDKSD